jgi:uncharacterized protein YchJ
LELDPGIRWYRLDIISRSKGTPLDSVGTVEFEAFYSGAGVGSQRELSSFLKERGRWFYLEAVTPSKSAGLGAFGRDTQSAIYGNIIANAAGLDHDRKN